ncbi:MAG: phosphoglycerate kinase [Candidatus Paceibacterota bacterium]
MEIKKIQEAELENKKVILRVGFDVSVENGHAKELFKIKTVKETVDYLVSKNAKIAMMTYFGRPRGKKDIKFSLNQLVGDIEQALGYKIKFVPDCIGKKVEEAMDNLGEKELIMLENVRFYPGEGDFEMGLDYDEEFAKKLAQGFDFFINDAFSQSHRSQASISGIPKYIPSYAGFLMQKEIENLNHVLHEPDYPATAIIGGAKIETKLPLIKAFEKTYTHVLVGGRVANEAIDQKIEFSAKVILPNDFAKDRLDIGEKTLERFKDIINHSKVVVWNGPMGKFEEPPYDKGTRDILDAVADCDGFTLIGGGESVQVLEENGLMDKVSFVSTGGGAMLEYLSGNSMPGIEALKK